MTKESHYPSIDQTNKHVDVKKYGTMNLQIFQSHQITYCGL